MPVNEALLAKDARNLLAHGTAEVVGRLASELDFAHVQVDHGTEGLDEVVHQIELVLLVMVKETDRRDEAMRHHLTRKRRSEHGISIVERRGERAHLGTRISRLVQLEVDTRSARWPGVRRASLL